MRDIMVQVLATVMIPLTVAGTGLYYTRWQQNLSDLKTMIDLVSDENSEKRKFGIAMLEYLLKNDKVPVEFVAAQLDYANSSSDKQMLPLMESALMKAADENPAVAETFRKALERLPSRLFVHVMTDQQRACISTMLLSLKDADRAQVSVPLIAQVNWDGKQHELRVLKDSANLSYGTNTFTFGTDSFSETGLSYTPGSVKLLLGTVGVKVKVHGLWLVTGSVLFPLNDNGVKPGLTPVVGFERSF